MCAQAGQGEWTFAVAHVVRGVCVVCWLCEWVRLSVKLCHLCLCCGDLREAFTCPYSSVVEHPLSKRKVGSSILLGGISLCSTHRACPGFITKASTSLLAHTTNPTYDDDDESEVYSVATVSALIAIKREAPCPGTQPTTYPPNGIASLTSYFAPMFGTHLPSIPCTRVYLLEIVLHRGV